MYEDLREVSGKGSDENSNDFLMVELTVCTTQFEWDHAIKTIFGDFRSSPTQIQRDQEKFCHEGGEHEVCRRGEFRSPSAPPSSSGTPTVSQSWSLMVLDSFHNLRMIHEGRTNATILV